MKKHLWSLLLCFEIFVCAKAQTAKPAFSPDDLQINWKVVTNSYQNKPGYLSEFTITNISKKPLPAAGWSIYFNLPRTIDTTFKSGDIKFSRVNGDLSKMSPAASFSGLKPGQQIKIQMLASDWTLNKADAPGGLYLVWDSEPQEAKAIANYKIIPSMQAAQTTRNASDVLPVATAAITYNRNKKITDIPAQKLVKIFPTPASYHEGEGFYSLTPDVTISADAAFQNEATYLTAELKNIFGKSPMLASGGGIVLRKAPMAEEAYELHVTAAKIELVAGTPAGAFYGIQSLKTMLPAQAWAVPQKSVQVPVVTVKDAPRFGWRAFMLDVARNFQTKETLLKTIDLLSLYKINVLHLHCTEDEGWRVEIPGLPELTEIGGKRGHKDFDKVRLPPSFNSGPDNKGNVSGFYTKEDFIEILKFAQQRHIKVIPEVEMPGHARAAVVAMQMRHDRLLSEGKGEEAKKYLLRSPGDTSRYRSVQGWNDNIMDVALPSTYAFLEKVVDGFIAMYGEAGVPLETIHMGGDEVPAGAWQGSPAFAKLRSENTAIKTTDDLWYYCYGNINKLMRRKGLYLYGWEEAGMRKTALDGKPYVFPNPDFAAQNVQLDVWNNLIGWGAEDLAYRLANAGYKVVLSPVSNLYFDMSYEKAFEEEGYYWGGFVDADKPFSFIPYDYLKNTSQDRMGHALNKDFLRGKERLTDYGKSNIIGIQGLLFSETVYSAERMEYMLLPKLLGLAERAWAPEPAWATEPDSASAETLYREAWSAFANVLGKRELPRLNYYAGGFRYRIPPPGAVAEAEMVKAAVQYPGLQIRYTTDGSEPTIKSKLYTGPISNKGVIKLKVFDAKGRGSRTETAQNASKTF